MPDRVENSEFVRIQVSLRGAVQGVGFRPFVFRLATELGLCGWVQNSSAGVEVEVEGPAEATGVFLSRLEGERPPAAVVLAREVSRLAPAGYRTFEIRASEAGGAPTAVVPADLATCGECLADLRDPSNRRYRYPFTNCTNCGPRYTIVLDIPYDRAHTTMRAFSFCADCRREYADPADRRFHAEPNACPVCGPRLSFVDPWGGVSVGWKDLGQPVAAAAGALADGRILALKGIGGFQLLVDAGNAEAVRRLRRRKNREEKPFALMMPSLAMARRYCRISFEEEALLCSPAAPIVLLPPSGAPGIAPEVAQSSPYLGVMLPYSPLHHLLLGEFPRPVVATSGNRSDEPIATGNEEALERLGEIADVYLLHDRPVARPCDDSVVRICRGAPMLIRRARGYAPLPVCLDQDLPPLLAVGGHLKNSVAIAMGREVFLSQHIGDLDTVEARRAFERAIDDLCRLYRFHPEAVVCDLHPDYASTLWARSSGLRVIAVQHHRAHAAACAAENGVSPPYLAFCWDGAGYGDDGTIWGGEVFQATSGGFRRVAHLRPFRLPGGEAAMRQAWRSAAGLQWEAGLAGECPPIVRRMLERGVNCPMTTSVGRLFDAVAAMTGVAWENRFEGQAAMRLERAIGACRTADAYPLPGGDWEPLICAVSADVRRGTSVDRIAARFHNALAAWIVETARQAASRQVIMSGGVFQNRYLTERAAGLLEAEGLRVYTHQRVPANDGGLALGQIALGAVAFAERERG